jgi:hypothetical protein
MAGAGNATRARQLAAIRTFLRFLARQQGMAPVAIAGLRGPRRKPPLPRALSPADAREVGTQIGAVRMTEATPRPQWQAARDAALFTLLYGCGLRIAEADLDRLIAELPGFVPPDPAAWAEIDAAVGAEIDEASLMDGAGPVRKFFSVTIPMLRPTLFTVLTLGLIGSWQVFDQIYVLGGASAGGTIATPAFLAYRSSFVDLEWGQGAAIAFILFLFIIVLTLLQRWFLKERGPKKRKAAAKPAEHPAESSTAFTVDGGLR